MTDRIHDCLDGERSRSDLTAEERRELNELETVVEESVTLLQEAPVPDMAPGVMERIRTSEEAAGSPERSEDRGIVGVLEDVVAWLWTPRPVRVRPAWALAGVAVLVLATAVLPLRTGGPAGTEAEIADQATDGPTLYVRFELETPEASSVAVAGTFSDWQPRYELSEAEPGRWTALVPLRPGVHEYAFVVDGERWIADPGAPRVRDGFGGVNSQIALVPPAHNGNGRS